LKPKEIIFKSPCICLTTKAIASNKMWGLRTGEEDVRFTATDLPF